MRNAGATTAARRMRRSRPGRPAIPGAISVRNGFLCSLGALLVGGSVALAQQWVPYGPPAQGWGYYPPRQVAPAWAYYPPRPTVQPWQYYPPQAVARGWAPYPTQP
jgi:hypothetical protein